MPGPPDNALRQRILALHAPAAMALSINTNLAAMNAQRHQARSQIDLSTAIARISSGLRINSASDDAAGLAIADRMTAQIRGTAQAGRNANDCISLAQTAEAALASIDDNLQRIRELAVQAANASNSASDRASLQVEVTQLQGEIERVASQSAFNGTKLLDGSFQPQSFQVGSDRGQSINLAALASARTDSLGVTQGFSTGYQGLFGPTAGVLTVAIGSGPTINLGTMPPDAIAVAGAINRSGIAGLSAVVQPGFLNWGTSAASASASGSGALTLNGTVIALPGLSGAANLAGNRAQALAAINAQSAATGAIAYLTPSGSGIRLEVPDGRTMTVAYAAGSFTGSTGADFGLYDPAPGTAITSGSGLTLSYTAPAGTTGNVVFSHAGAGAFGFTHTYAIAGQGMPVAAIDISSVNGSNAALGSIDAALASVGSARASLGAVQNRFASTVDNLRASGEYLSASRSRIQDADFAQETANLSRAQVLQQAGTAMLAQANQLPGQVLTLLR